MSNTIVTVYADGGCAVGLTDENPRGWKYLQSEAGAQRHVVEAVVAGDLLESEAALRAEGLAYMAGERPLT